MDIYSISISSNFLIGDGTSQAYCVENDEITRAFTKDPFPRFDMPLKFELHKRAKITNCLSHAPIVRGFLIDEKLKYLLDQMKLIEHKYYPAKVLNLKNNNILQYYLLEAAQDLTNFIDFENSVFYEKLVFNIGDKIKLSSLSEYNLLRKDKGWKWDVKCEKLVIKNDFINERYDLYSFFPFSSKFLVSRKLMEKIESEGILGFEFERISNITYL